MSPYLPPPEFDRPAIVQPHIWHRSPVMVDRLCRLLGAEPRDIRACALGGHEQCIMILPPLGSPNYDALYRHERAHCNGWRH